MYTASTNYPSSCCALAARCGKSQQQPFPSELFTRVQLIDPCKYQWRASLHGGPPARPGASIDELNEYKFIPRCAGAGSQSPAAPPAAPRRRAAPRAPA